MRSKTTGEGRRVEIQDFYVSAAWLQWPYWLKTGWEIFVDMGKRFGNQGRDFLLPRPDKHLTGFRWIDGPLLLRPCRWRGLS